MYTGTGVVIPYNASDGLNHLTNIIYSFHMPLYMSVSGYMRCAFMTIKNIRTPHGF